MTGTMMNHGACNGAPTTVDKPGSASSIVHHAPSLNGKSLTTRRSLLEERRIGNVLLRITHCDSGHCKEFTVVSITFKYYQCLIGTLALVTIGYYLQLHLRDPRLVILMLILLITGLVVRLSYKVTQESLLVMASVGIQVTTTFALGQTSTKFYHISHIKNVVINEAVTMHRVIYYLTVLLQEETNASEQAKVTQLMPLFQHCWPSLECLELVYQGIQQLLFDQAKKHT